MSSNIGTQEQGTVVDYAELLVCMVPLQKRLEAQLNAQDFDGATITALEFKVLMGALYWHLVERPHIAINYDAGINQT